MLALGPEIGRAGHPVDLFAHLGKGGNDPLPLRLRILGDGMLDMDARLVEDDMAPRHAHHQLQAGHDVRSGFLHPRIGRAVIGQFGIGDQLGQHHGDRLQRLDLDLFIFARLDMLHAQHAQRALAPHDRHAGKAVEQLLAGFRAIGKVGMGGGLVQVQRLDIGGDQADQPLALGHAGDMHRLLLQAAGREQFQHALAHQIDGADLARQRFADDLHHLVQLGLRAGARRHHLLQADEDLAGGGGGRTGHGKSLTDAWLSFQALSSRYVHEPRRKARLLRIADKLGHLPHLRGGYMLYIRLTPQRQHQACLGVRDHGNDHANGV